MNYMLNLPVMENIQHFRNISRYVKHTHSETNYDHLIEIIIPGKEGEKTRKLITDHVCNLV
jgi:hypothetical protein